jgi:hypothetical protein
MSVIQHTIAYMVIRIREFRWDAGNLVALDAGHGSKYIF